MLAQLLNEPAVRADLYARVCVPEAPFRRRDYATTATDEAAAVRHRCCPTMCGEPHHPGNLARGRRCAPARRAVALGLAPLAGQTDQLLHAVTAGRTGLGPTNGR
jgi:hypothetical protein